MRAAAHFATQARRSTPGPCEQALLPNIWSVVSDLRTALAKSRAGLLTVPLVTLLAFFLAFAAKSAAGLLTAPPVSLLAFFLAFAAKSAAGLLGRLPVTLLAFFLALAAKSAAGLLGRLPVTLLTALFALAANWDGSGMPSTTRLACVAYCY